MLKFSFVLIIIFAFTFMSCEESTVNPPVQQKGSIFIESTPSGAKFG